MIDLTAHPNVDAERAGALPWGAMTDREQRGAIMLLSGHTFKATAAALGVSHGWVYENVALRYGLRKYEEKHRRKAQSERERQSLLERALNRTLQADALDFLKALPTGSVDLVVSSPPYNIGRGYADDNDRLPFMEYIATQMLVISQVARVLKPGGTVVYQIGTTKDDDGERYFLDELLAPHFRQAKLTYQDRIAWLAQSGLTPKYHLANRYETALVFSKGKQATWNPNAIRVVQKNPGKRAFKGPRRGELSGHPLGGYPTDTWFISRVMANHPERTGHPAQFPIEFPRRAILAYTMPGDLVADMYAGSGSTQIACVRTGRNFVGSDIGYAEMREARLRGEVIDTFTPFSGVTEESLALWVAEAGKVVASSWDVDAHRISTTAAPISDDVDREMCLSLFSAPVEAMAEQ